MHFWCSHCEVDFEAEPNSKLYDQVDCPTCQQGCLTFETEYEDALSQVAFKNMFGSLFFGVIGSLFQSFASSKTKQWDPPILRVAEKMNYRRPMVASFRSHDDAIVAGNKLGDRYIDCRVVECDGEFCLHVDEEDEERAKRIVKQWLQSRSN